LGKNDFEEKGSTFLTPMLQKIPSPFIQIEDHKGEEKEVISTGKASDANYKLKMEFYRVKEEINEESEGENEDEECKDTVVIDT
jgi:hypothetical protein